MSLRHVDATTVVLLLLVSVLAIALRLGLLEAVMASILGASLLDYFFLPAHTRGWGLDNPEDWLAFCTFLAVAIVTGQLAARVKRQKEEAVARQEELEKLYAFGHTMKIEGTSGSIVAGCVASLVDLFGVRAAAFCDLSTGDVTRAGAQASLISEDSLRAAAAGRCELFRESSSGTLFVPLCCAGEVVGTLVISAGDMSELTLRAVADRIEVGLEKVSAYEKLRRAEQTRRSQELKTALLDSLAHEIKTPLSVVTTCASSLQSQELDAASRDELTSIICEEADRLDTAISQVFWTARGEAGALQSGKGPHNLRALIEETVHDLKPLLRNRPMTIEVPDLLPAASCDSSMIKAVLKELLTNAVKYSPSDSPLAVSVQQAGDRIVTSVADRGIGLKPADENRIFEKHYRRAAPGTPGLGLGLAITKTIVEAHGGKIAVESRAGGGSVFRFSLPISHRDVA